MVRGQAGQRVDRRFRWQQGRHQGHQVHKFSPKSEKLLSLGVAGKAGNAEGEFNQPNDVVVGPDGSIYVSDGHEAQGMIAPNAASPDPWSVDVLIEPLWRGPKGRMSAAVREPSARWSDFSWTNTRNPRIAA
jgi:hypothetical protein